MGLKSNRVKVQFLYHKGYEKCFAFFPEKKYDKNPHHGFFKCFEKMTKRDNYFKPCHVSYLEDCREATSKEYMPVLKELDKMIFEYKMYDDFEIISYNPIKNWLIYQKAGYLKFGKTDKGHKKSK